MTVFTSKVGSITESSDHFPVLIDDIQNSMLDKVHLGPNGAILGHIVPGQEDIEGDPGDYGGNECLAGVGKERDNSDEVLAGVAQYLLWKMWRWS